MPQMVSGGGGGSSFTYAGDTEPADPREGETWWDTGAQEAKVYTANGTWSLQTLDDHSELAGVRADNHHARPVPGNALGEDADGNFNVQEGNISHGNLGNVEPDQHHAPHQANRVQAGAGNSYNNDDSRYRPDAGTGPFYTTVGGGEYTHPYGNYLFKVDVSMSCVHDGKTIELTKVGYDHAVTGNREWIQTGINTVLGSTDTYSNTLTFTEEPVENWVFEWYIDSGSNNVGADYAFTGYHAKVAHHDH